MKQLAGSELGICLLGVFLHLRTLIQDSLFRVHRLPALCAPSLFTDYSLARFPFVAHLFHLFLDVHVSIFKIRPGILGIFLTKLCLFFPFFFLSLFDHLCLSYSLIPATTAGKLSTRSKISPFVYWKLTSRSRSSYSQGCHLPRGISWFLKLPHLINQNTTVLNVVGKISEMTSSSPKYPDLIFQTCEYDDIPCCDFVFCCMAQLPLKQGDYPGGLDIIT